MTSSIEVFGNADLYGHLMCMLDLPDVVWCRAVCKVWNNTFKLIEVSFLRDIHVDNKLFVKDGKYSYKSKVALTETAKHCYNRAIWMKHGLVPVGPGCAEPTEYQINELWKEDPDSPGKKKFETYSEVHLYPRVKTTLCETEVAIFDEKDNLKITKQDAPSTSGVKEIEVGISPHNAIELFRRLSIEKKVIDPDNFFSEVSNHCFTCIATPCAIFVQRIIPASMLGISWEDKLNRLVDTPNAGILPLIFKFGFDILTAENTTSRAFAITPDIIQARDGQPAHLIIGTYKDGIDIFNSKDGYRQDSIGMVPCILPEPTQAAPEAPAAEKKE